GFSIRINGKSGIRIKTGINSNLRKELINQGVDGYKATEYGTIVMNKSNRDKYPFVKGGEKTSYGIAYGTDSSGKKVDAIFETVNGVDRYTSVLTGLPASAYKRDFSFRGYIVLSGNGRTVTIYGPPASNNIYNLATRQLNSGAYPVGSSVDQFLRQIIADGDNPPTP
ncbi:MAG: hypothetical protein IK068_06230, partial [Lachnospiraceae bacterium]|nr:hypothetical protein [Lachnospiraceae bacterium]